MQWFMNLPVFLIVLPLAASPILSVLKPKASKGLLLTVSAMCLTMSAMVLYHCAGLSEGFVIKMGEIGAPFGNELLVTSAEAVVSTLFSAVMFLSLLAGMRRVGEEIDGHRQSLFCTVSSLLLAAIQAIAYTNDLFTGYVFLEITTIAAGALIFLRSREGALFAAMRYMLMNLLGSGLFLLGLSVFYCLTGQLLFPQLKEGATAILALNRYMRPFTVAVLLMSLGLAVKSALYPFHTWLPNAYSGATPAASSMLSSLVSKAYIFLLIKIIVRGVSMEAFTGTKVSDIIFLYSVIAIILGSWDAMKEHNIRRMVSYSSVAQIGYIFLALSFGTAYGMAAAIFHIAAHSVAKAMLFPAVDRLTEVSGGNENYRDLRGSGVRAPLAGIAFMIGAFSITGMPFLGGFASKIYIATAAVEYGGWRMLIALGALAVSTILNVIYFLRTVITIYRPGEKYPLKRHASRRPVLGAAVIAFMGLNVFLGVWGMPVLELILKGIGMW